MLVVVDTNVFLSALISPHGAPARLYEAWQDRQFQVATCTFQLDEIRRASRYPKLRAILKPHLVGRMMNTLQRAQIFENIPSKYAAADPDDAYLLDLAEFADVDYVVTGDKRAGLLTRKSVARARILTVSDFCHTALG